MKKNQLKSLLNYPDPFVQVKFPVTWHKPIWRGSQLLAFAVSSESTLTPVCEEFDPFCFAADHRESLRLKKRRSPAFLLFYQTFRLFLCSSYTMVFYVQFAEQLASLVCVWSTMDWVFLISGIRANQFCSRKRKSIHSSNPAFISFI